MQIVELNQTLDGGDVQESVAKFEKAVVSEPNNAIYGLFGCICMIKQNRMIKQKMLTTKH
ncbi:MAG: hypothetical protein IPF58_11505 [Saprospirales bacterium]|nr:hypothetical protein [Saprospirales bacterium]